MSISFKPDNHLFLCFDDAKMDTSRPVWFVRTGIDVDALPWNGVAWHGNELYELKRCREFFTSFPAVFLAIADKELREDLADVFEQYLPQVRLFMPADGAFHGAESVSEVVKAAGTDADAAIDALCAGARERPAFGLLNIAAVRQPDSDSSRVVLSGFAELDRDLGGFAPGELSVWTGKRGSGKSTLLSQMMLEAVEQGHKVCVFSGELDAWRYKSWALLQAAGRRNIIESIDGRSGKRMFSVAEPQEDAINAWWDGRLFLYDNHIAGATQADKILTVFGIAVLRYGCHVFLVDNLMATDFRLYAENDFYRAQSAFVGGLVDFAKRNMAHVHLIAHPRKLEQERNLRADDIGGSSGITDRADNVFALTRLNPIAAAEKGYSLVLQVLKNRSDGLVEGYSLCFDPVSRRFFKAGSGNPDKRYAWEPQQLDFQELENDPTAPF